MSMEPVVRQESGGDERGPSQQWRAVFDDLTRIRAWVTLGEPLHPDRSSISVGRDVARRVDPTQVRHRISITQLRSRPLLALARNPLGAGSKPARG
jgi:hypothetical protein